MVRESPLLTTTSDTTRWCACDRTTCGGVNLDELGGENRGVRIADQLGFRARAVVVAGSV
jgi:hypothetical protein